MVLRRLLLLFLAGLTIALSPLAMDFYRIASPQTITDNSLCTKNLQRVELPKLEKTTFSTLPPATESGSFSPQPISIDWGTAFWEAGKTLLIAGMVIGIGRLALVTGIVLATDLAAIGLTLLLIVGAISFYQNLTRANLNGVSNPWADATIATTDRILLGKLGQGITGKDLVTGELLNSQESSKNIGSGGVVVATEFAVLLLLWRYRCQLLKDLINIY